MQFSLHTLIQIFTASISEVIYGENYHSKKKSFKIATTRELRRMFQGNENYKIKCGWKAQACRGE
jgi:hypothetical protein